MTNKQSQAEQPAAVGEGMSAELLLKSWNKTLEIVEECRRINAASGVRDPDQYVEALDIGGLPMGVQKYNLFIEKCISKKSGKPHTLESLINSNVISEEERQYYPLEPVGRELLSMSRVQAVDKSEWLVKFEKWNGLDGESGAPYSITVDSLDFYKKIPVEYTTVPIDPTRKSKEVRVARIARILPGFEGLRRTYTTPFNLENVNTSIRDAQKPTSDPTIAKTALYLVRDMVTNISMVPDLESWMTDDFDTLFDSRLSQNQNAKLDLKELVLELQKQSNTASQSAGQYQ